METKEIKINIPEGYEIDKENSTFECIKFKKKIKVNTWKNIPRVNGCYMNNSHIYTDYEGKPCEENKDVYLTDKYVKSALALAQISQLMPYYGGEVTNEEWKNNERKFSIVVHNGELKPFTHVNNKVLTPLPTDSITFTFFSFKKSATTLARSSDRV